MTEVMPEVDDEVVAPALTCADCGTVVTEDEGYHGPDYNRRTGNYDAYYCYECRVTCDGCGSHADPDNTHVTEDGGVYGRCCTRSCYQCGEQLIPNDERYVRRYGEYVCDDCRPNEENRIQPYGHTRASRWLRLPHERGRRSGNRDLYYLGMELEIGTNNMTAEHVRKWAKRNLGHADAMVCKEDSSVEGFEIVTQPMTPAFFESRDWDSFFEVINREHPCQYGGDEPEDHGLHVHIGRIAFGKDDIMIAAFAYLLSQSDQLERIGRRRATGYCNKVRNPVKVVIGQSQKDDVQARRIKAMGIYPGRDAINLSNDQTIEIRAFKSTRKAEDFKDAVRTVYTAAEYVRSLREGRVGMGGKALHWSEFTKWVLVNYPDAYKGVLGVQ